MLTLGTSHVAAADPAAERLVATLTLRQKLAQLLIVRFNGQGCGDDVVRMVGAQGAGAAVVYAIEDNIAAKGQLRALTRCLQRASALPLVVAIDQEGGRVDRLADVRGPHPAAAAIAERGDPAVAWAEGAADARHLARLGIQLNLAPVVDVTQIYNAQLEARTWGAMPDVVTRMAGAYLEGLQASGRVVGTLKHFPGLGAVAEDPHWAVPHLGARREDMASFDWVPYRELIHRGDVHAVMVTHMYLDTIDPDRPASLSPLVVNGILRGDLAFDGVVVADALSMHGVGTTAGLGDIALQAVIAGADWLMGPKTPADVEEVVGRLERAVADGTLDVGRVDASLRRVLALKARVGLLPPDA
jgi:beta-N-acetylhexosaminidase